MYDASVDVLFVMFYRLTVQNTITILTLSEYATIELQAGTIAKGKLSDFKQRQRTTSVRNYIFKREPHKYKVALNSIQKGLIKFANIRWKLYLNILHGHNFIVNNKRHRASI